MKKLVVFSGSGMSAESGIQTFRDAGGLWEQHNIEDVATPEAFRRNPKLVLDFYNKRRKQVIESEPNDAHKALVKLEGKYDVTVITQNIDDLHERAGSSDVLHLHGEIRKAQSSLDPKLVYDIDGWEIKWGEKCERGSQLRPHVVWFGEMVPNMEPAAKTIGQADVLLVIGTSLQVYPAAGLVYEAPPHCDIYLVDPDDLQENLPGVTYIKEKAGVGVPGVVEELIR